MSVVASVRALQELDEVDLTHRRGPQESPHVTIRILNVAAPAPAVTTIEAKPLELEPAEPYRDEHGVLIDPTTGRRIFDPYR